VFAITVCRPDQGPFCVPTFYASANESIAPIWAPLISITLGLIILAILRKSLLIQHFFAISLSVIGAIGYWTFDTWEAHGLLLRADNFKTTSLYCFWLGIAIQAIYVNKGNLTSTVYSFLLLFQKPMGQASLHLLTLYIIIDTKEYLLNQEKGTNMQIDMWFYLGLLGFFSTGHQNQLASVQYDTGFIGLKEANYILSPLYITLNTIGGPILLSTVSLGPEQYKHRIVNIVWTVTSATLFAGFFARHSQAFRVWGPKFLFFLLNTVGIMVGMAIEHFVPSEPKLKLD
jgi:phosphatidylinositol glycan class O